MRTPATPRKNLKYIAPSPLARRKNPPTVPLCPELPCLDEVSPPESSTGSFEPEVANVIPNMAGKGILHVLGEVQKDFQERNSALFTSVFRTIADSNQLLQTEVK